MALMAYKAVSTLDSTFGYKNERYLEFGWASAKLDDILNFIPSRITGVLTSVAALILGQKWLQAAWAFMRDRSKHPSPNAGQAEAAFAGALGIQLGGLSYYGGSLPTSPRWEIRWFRFARAYCSGEHASLVTSGLALALFLGTRLAVLSWWV